MRPAATWSIRVAAKGGGPNARMSRGCRDARVAAACSLPVARISIGDAIMRKLTATEKLSRTPESLLGVSPLPVPSSAGDNRPYISNLAGQLADTRFAGSTCFAHFVGSIRFVGGVT